MGGFADHRGVAQSLEPRTLAFPIRFRQLLFFGEFRLQMRGGKGARVGGMPGPKTRSGEDFMKNWVRRAVIAASLLALAPAVASASQSTRYVFAWAYGNDGNTFYVSNSAMSVDNYDYSAAARRWDSARERENLVVRTRNSMVGTPGDVLYENVQDAEDARNRMANQERNTYGKSVVVVSW